MPPTPTRMPPTPTGMPPTPTGIPPLPTGMPLLTWPLLPLPASPCCPLKSGCVPPDTLLAAPNPACPPTGTPGTPAVNTPFCAPFGAPLGALLGAPSIAWPSAVLNTTIVSGTFSLPAATAQHSKQTDSEQRSNQTVCSIDKYLSSKLIFNPDNTQY